MPQRCEIPLTLIRLQPAGGDQRFHPRSNLMVNADLFDANENLSAFTRSSCIDHARNCLVKALTPLSDVSCFQLCCGPAAAPPSPRKDSANDHWACPTCSTADAPTGTVDFTLTSVSNQVASGGVDVSSDEQVVIIGSDVTAQLI